MLAEEACVRSLGTSRGVNVLISICDFIRSGQSRVCYTLRRKLHSTHDPHKEDPKVRSPCTSLRQQTVDDDDEARIASRSFVKLYLGLIP